MSISSNIFDSTESSLSEAFENLYREESSEAILKRVRKMEQSYRVQVGLSVTFAAIGGGMATGLAGGPFGNLGLVVLMGGFFGAGVATLQTVIYLNLMWPIWARLKRREEELRRTLAEDL